MAGNATGLGTLARSTVAVFMLMVLGSLIPLSAFSQASPLLTVRSTASATLGEGTKAQVHAKAKSLAMRKAIEEHVGVVITSQTTMQNWEVAEDAVSSYARVYFKSIREISYNYDSATETGVYEGEFVIDASSLERLSGAQSALEAEKENPVEAAVFLYDEQGGKIADGGTVRGGGRFNVMVRPAVDLHAYVVNRDSRGNLFRIFPNPQVSGHENPLREGRSYLFPPRDSDQIFSFDGNPGTEDFYVLLSAAPLADLDALFEQLDGGGGEEARRLMAPIIQERIAARGIRMQATGTETSLSAAGGGNGSASPLMGEVLSGSGAFVKKISLHHVK